MSRQLCEQESFQVGLQVMHASKCVQCKSAVVVGCRPLPAVADKHAPVRRGRERGERERCAFTCTSASNDATSTDFCAGILHGSTGARHPRDRRAEQRDDEWRHLSRLCIVCMLCVSAPANAGSCLAYLAIAYLWVSEAERLAVKRRGLADSQLGLCIVSWFVVEEAVAG